MILKNLTDNAKNLAANAKMEDMSRLIKNMAGKQDVKNALSGVMVKVSFYSPNLTKHYNNFFHLFLFKSVLKPGDNLTSFNPFYIETKSV